MMRQAMCLIAACMLSMSSMAYPVLQVDSIGRNDIRAYIYNDGDVNETLTKSVGNILIGNHIPVVTSIGQANVFVKLKCTVKKGGVVRGEMYNFNEYFTSVEVQLDNAKTSQLLFNYNNFDYRTLSPVSTSEATAKNVAIREVMRKVEKDLGKKLTAELDNINKSVVQSRASGTGKQAASVGSAISLNDSYYTHSHKVRMTMQEQEESKVDKITCNSIVFQGREFVRGIKVSGNKQGRLESVLYVGEHGVYEYLVSYNASGEYVDCMEIGCVMDDSGLKKSAVIEGSKITLSSPHGIIGTYHVSNEMTFTQ